MRRSLAVVKALLDMRFAPEVARYWYRGFRMSEFGRKTPIMVLSEDRTEVVIEILKRVFQIERPGIPKDLGLGGVDPAVSKQPLTQPNQSVDLPIIDRLVVELGEDVHLRTSEQEG